MSPDHPTRENPKLLAAATEWFERLHRTLKTDRLYGHANPATTQARAELAAGLVALTDRDGPLRAEFGPREILVEGVAVYEAASREDNLAGVFHRDGIRGVTFRPSVEAAEVDRFFDIVVMAMGPSALEDDLVTLLWTAELPSIHVDSVQLEHDVDSMAGDEAERSPIPWPAGSTSGIWQQPSETELSGPPRSDDWEVLARAADPVESFETIETTAIHEVARFQAEQETEGRGGLLAGVVLVLEQALDTPTSEADRVTLLPFLQRVLAEAMAQGSWGNAHRTLGLLRACDATWSAHGFLGGLELGAEGAARRSAEAVDRQAPEDLLRLTEFAEALGVEAVDWLMRIIASSERKRVRMALLKSIILLATKEPERLVPWLSDERWFVVRNAVHVLGEIGGDRLLPLMRSVSRHPEPRVRRELVQAVGRMSPAVAHPMLLEMLGSPDLSVLQAILAQLARRPDPAVAAQLIGLLRAPDFPNRPEPYRHSLYRAIASQGDVVVPELEVELRSGSIFNRSLDPHWQAVGRCLAHVNTPAALAVLERGAASSRSGVAKACQQALREARRTHG